MRRVYRMSYMNFMNNGPTQPAPVSNPYLADWVDYSTPPGSQARELSIRVMEEWTDRHRVPAIIALARRIGPEALLPEIMMALSEANPIRVEAELLAITTEMVERN